MKPFFIGWMGLPKGLRLFIAGAVAILVLSQAAIAALLYLGQPPRATGVWGDGEQSFEGTLLTLPYPMVRLAPADGKPARTILLVDEWKFGLPLGSDFKDGDKVGVRGYSIERNGVTVLQVSAPLDRLAAGAAMPGIDRGEQTLTGEIVDSKCWTGAMNPGDGKAHKGCGSLCLLGGIPALFIPANGSGWYVLADGEGQSLGEDIRARIGERLTLKGRLFGEGDLRILRVDADSLLNSPTG